MNVPGGALEPLRIPQTLWQRDDVRAALRDRDIRALFLLLRQYAGASQTRIGMAVGMAQSHVSAIMRGTREVTDLATFERIADGLGMPNDRRICLGLAPMQSQCLTTPGGNIQADEQGQRLNAMGGEDRAPQPPDNFPPGDDGFSFAAATQAQWPSTLLSTPVPDNYGTDWNLLFPGGRSFEGAGAAVQLHRARNAPGGCSIVDITDTRRLSQFLKTPHRGLVIGAQRAPRGVHFLGLDSREARRQLAARPAEGASLSIPAAYELDDFTYGLMWAVANLDDALLADDLELTEIHQGLRAYEQLSGSAVSREAAGNLTSVSCMWLGSNFCARHILRNVGEMTDVPIFWTREQRGEEAGNWLLFRHKYAYLWKTAQRFGGVVESPTRAFCVPEDAVRDSPAHERILLFLSVALMESFGIRAEVCVEPDYSQVEGFVLARGRRAVIANWVRAEGVWHVDTTARRSLLRAFADVGGHATAHSVIGSATSAGRLEALARYLGLSWPWLVRRCAELGEHRCEGLVQPRSRLLSVAGLNAACEYVGSSARSSGKGPTAHCDPRTEASS